MKTSGVQVKLIVATFLILTSMYTHVAQAGLTKKRGFCAMLVALGAFTVATAIKDFSDQGKIARWEEWQQARFDDKEQRPYVLAAGELLSRLGDIASIRPMDRAKVIDDDAAEYYRVLQLYFTEMYPKLSESFKKEFGKEFPETPDELVSILGRLRHSEDRIYDFSLDQFPPIQYDTWSRTQYTLDEVTRARWEKFAQILERITLRHQNVDGGEKRTIQEIHTLTFIRVRESLTRLAKARAWIEKHKNKPLNVILEEGELALDFQMLGSAIRMEFERASGSNHAQLHSYLLAENIFELKESHLKNPYLFLSLWQQRVDSALGLRAKWDLEFGRLPLDAANHTIGDLLSVILKRIGPN